MSTPEVALTENVSIIDGSFFLAVTEKCVILTDCTEACFTHAPSAVCMRAVCRVHYVCCAEAAQTHCAFTQDAFAVRS